MSLGQARAHVQSLLPSLLPAEQAVARVLLAREDIAELSSQQVADLAGCSRATVVRTCQTLGWSGWQQLRVLLARDALVLRSSDSGVSEAADDDPAGIVAQYFRRLAATAEQMAALLDGAQVSAAVTALGRARRVMVVANGLTAPLSVDLQARLVRVGIDAVHHADVMQQHITASLLGPDDVVFAISGSGANSHTLTVVRAARQAGATVVVVTAFARSAVAALAEIVLLVAAPDNTFGAELTETSRIPQTVLIEGLCEAVRRHLGARAEAAAARTLQAVSTHIGE